MSDEQPPPKTTPDLGVDRVEVEKPPVIKGREDNRYDANLLWRVYVQCEGVVRRMLELNDPSIPKSIHTLQRYAKRYKWKEKLSEQLAAQHIQHVPSLADASRRRLEKLVAIQDALFDLLTPKILPDGTKEWALPPTKFESTLDKFLKLIERVEVMSGGVTSRSEVKKHIQVNVNIVCAVFGRVLNEFAREGQLTLKTARAINDRFFERIGKHEITLSTEATAKVFSSVESENED